MARDDSLIDPEVESGEISSILEVVPDAELDPSRPIPATHYTDLGNAERLAEQHGADLRYCSALGGWLAWDASRWRRDEMLSAQGRAHETARSLYAEVATIAEQLSRAKGDDQKKMLSAMLDAARAHAKRSESSRSLAAMLHEARAIKPIPAEQNAFDAPATNLMLNAPNGTIDLATGILRPHRRADLITRVTGSAYDPSALAPRFNAFLARVQPDPEIRAFLQLWAGYCATGLIREHLLPIWYGIGANGKSTLSDSLSAVLGDYAVVCPGGFFEETKHRQHPTEIARLKGARLAVASETEHSAQLAEARVKDLTGGDTLTGRFMHANFFDFIPTTKFLLFTNHRPRIRSTDEGIRRRLVLVPWQEQIAADEKILGLADILIRDEGPGILRWIVEGAVALLAQEGRLDPPASIQLATSDYLAGEDTVGRYLDEDCTVRPPGDATIRSQPSHLHAAYTAWCAAEGEAACHARDFAARLAARGYETHRSHGLRWILGLAPAASQSPSRDRTGADSEQGREESWDD